MVSIFPKEVFLEKIQRNYCVSSIEMIVGQIDWKPAKRIRSILVFVNFARFAEVLAQTQLTDTHV